MARPTMRDDEDERTPPDTDTDPDAPDDPGEGYGDPDNDDTSQNADPDDAPPPRGCAPMNKAQTTVGQLTQIISKAALDAARSANAPLVKAVNALKAENAELRKGFDELRTSTAENIEKALKAQDIDDRSSAAPGGIPVPDGVRVNQGGVINKALQTTELGVDDGMGTSEATVAEQRTLVSKAIRHMENGGEALITTDEAALVDQGLLLPEARLEGLRSKLSQVAA